MSTGLGGISEFANRTASQQGLILNPSDSSMSPAINELATALCKAQAKIGGAKKDSSNPFFKSQYADLESVWDACRKELTENGLAVVQTMEPSPEGVVVVTILTHSSGQWIKGKLALHPTKNDPQGIGSAITYGRRYALAAMVGVYQTDDDGNAASVKAKDEKPPKEEKAKAPFNISGEVVSVKTRNNAADEPEVWVRLKDGKTESLCVSHTDPNMSKLLDSEKTRIQLQVTESGKKYDGDDKALKGSPILLIHNVFPEAVKQ